MLSTEQLAAYNLKRVHNHGEGITITAAHGYSIFMPDEILAAICARRQSLSTFHAQAGAQPVAWQVHPFDYGVGSQGVYARTDRSEQVEAWERKGWKVEALYTHPAPESLQAGLGESEIVDMWNRAAGKVSGLQSRAIAFARAILARASAATVAEPSSANLEGLAKALLAPREIVRDEDGWLDHPALPTCDEGVNFGDLLGAFGLETYFRAMEGDAWQEVEDRYFEHGEAGCADWTPTLPDGDGWKLLAIYDTEDGPYAMFAREKQTEPRKRLLAAAQQAEPVGDERAARALCEAVSKRSDKTAGELWADYQAEFIADAQAVIAANTEQQAEPMGDERAALDPAIDDLAFMKAWPEIQKAGNNYGWLGIGLAAWRAAQSGQRAGVATPHLSLNDAMRDVFIERVRQQSEEGRTPEHDDEHGGGEMAEAAICYIQGYKVWHPSGLHQRWPWALEWWKPRDYRRNLVKACAIILAEIERLDRATAPTQQQGAAEIRGTGIQATMHHDAGAYARCDYCGRYSDNPKSLSRDNWPCDCGRLHGWCGSFKKPTAESQWSAATPTQHDDGTVASSEPPTKSQE